MNEPTRVGLWNVTGQERITELSRQLEDAQARNVDQLRQIGLLTLNLRAGMGELRVQRRLWRVLIETEEESRGPGSFRLGELAVGSIEHALELMNPQV